MSGISQSVIVSWFVMAQLPTPKKKEEQGDDKKTTGDALDPKLKAISDKIDSVFKETKKREGTTTTPDLGRDPLKTTNTAPIGVKRTPDELKERLDYIVLTRNPNLPDDGLGSNAGLRLQFELERGGHPGKAMPLAKYGAKAKDEGGLSLTPEIGKDGLPTGRLVSKDYTGVFILQFQDNSIVVTGRKDDKGKALPDATYVKNKDGSYTLDKSRSKQLLWTAPLTELGAYKLDSNEYTSWLPEQAQGIRGLNGRVHLMPQADGTIYDRTNKRTFVKQGEKWVWDTKRKEALPTTHIIRNHGLVPLPLMSPWAFRNLVNYYKPLPKPAVRMDRKIFLNSKNCMKHNPNSPFMHGPGHSYGGNDGFKLSLFRYDMNKDRDALLESLRRPTSTKKGRTFEDFILEELKKHKPEINPEGKKIPPPLGPFVQGYKGRDGYYIVTENKVYLFRDPSTVRGNNHPLVYNLGQGKASTVKDGSKYYRASGMDLAHLELILDSGNITSSSKPELKFAAK